MKSTRTRQQWMAAMEDFLLQLDPAFAGRIPWDAAVFHFNAGRSPGHAAMRIADAEQAAAAADKATERKPIDPSYKLLKACLYAFNAIPNTAPRGFAESTGYANTYALASAIDSALEEYKP